MGVHTHRPIKHEEASEQLQHLSEEVNRISATLDRLALIPQQRPEPASVAEHAFKPTLSVIRGIIRARSLRARYFDEELFADPAWDILLELFNAEVSQYRVSVSSLCLAAHVPMTTALRYITAMTKSGLLRRRPDPSDGRRVFMELTPDASNSLRHYFACLKDTIAV